jgi:EmrB/QacA subfamily drug resistance transporter
MTNIVKQPCDDGVIKSGEASVLCSASVGRWVLVATILGSSMAFVDGTVVNVALPVFQTELNATVTDVQWIVESYALLLAALLLAGGALGDRFGRRRVFAIGIGLFALSSAACGFSRSPGQLILFRGIQGVGGALLVPGSLAIISATFSKEKRGQAIGTWSGFTAITAAIGPVLGGWLVENLSWRWIFFVNVPIAAVVLIVLAWRVPESRDKTVTGRLDWPGALLATLGLGLLVFGLIESANLGVTHPGVVVALGLGLAGLIAFLFVESRTRSPMMPLDLFRVRNFTGANAVTFLLYSALSASLFFLPFNLVQVQGYSITEAGAAFLPLILIIFLLSRWAGGLIDRFGAKRPLVIGPSIAALGYVLMSLTGVGGGYWKTFFPAVATLGIGMAISVAPLTTVVMTAIDESKAGIASGVNNAVSRTAGLMAIAVLGVFVLFVFNGTMQNALSTLELPRAAEEQLADQLINLAAAEAPEDLDDETRRGVETAIAASFVTSFRRLMWVCAGLAALGAGAAGLVLEGGKRGQP